MLPSPPASTATSPSQSPRMRYAPPAAPVPPAAPAVDLDDAGAGDAAPRAAGEDMRAAGDGAGADGAGAAEAGGGAESGAAGMEGEALAPGPGAEAAGAGGEGGGGAVANGAGCEAAGAGDVGADGEAKAAGDASAVGEAGPGGPGGPGGEAGAGTGAGRGGAKAGRWEWARVAALVALGSVSAVLAVAVTLTVPLVVGRAALRPVVRAALPSDAPPLMDVYPYAVGFLLSGGPPPLLPVYAHTRLRPPLRPSSSRVGRSRRRRTARAGCWARLTYAWWVGGMDSGGGGRGAVGACVGVLGAVGGDHVWGRQRSCWRRRWRRCSGRRGGGALVASDGCSVRRGGRGKALSRRCRLAGGLVGGPRAE